LAWFYIISAFLSFLCGILTIISARNIFNKDKIVSKKTNISLAIFADNGKAIKYSIIFFSVVCFFAAIQSWMVLIKAFGSIPAVFIRATTIYQLKNQGEIKGIIPFISYSGFVAVFFSGIYTAYKRKVSFLIFLPLIGIIIKQLSEVGRVGMLFALMEFIFTFFLFRYLLKNDHAEEFKFSKINAIVSFTILITLFIVSASLVRLARSSFENYVGASGELRQLKGNMIITPSVYLYLSSDVGVLSQYLLSNGENADFGQNTFLPVYDLLAKFDFVKRPNDYQKGYFIPMWTNTGTYIRELHADFGVGGVFIVPYLLGLLITWLWFKFYESKNLIVFAFLVFLNIIIGFSFLVMITRLLYWSISLFMIIILIPILERIALSKRSSLVSIT
jgi:oligosaccharide repeat unit polymerase